jgi:hypothetical protein
MRISTYTYMEALTLVDIRNHGKHPQLMDDVYQTCTGHDPELRISLASS